MEFDAIVLGTGLSESIAAAALSKAGFKVAHVDNNQYYGGDEASLTLDELAEWADIRSGRKDTPSSDYLATQKERYTSISRSESIPPQSRQYAVSLAPSVVPSIGSHIDALVASGVSRYGSFKLLEKVAVYDRPGFVQSVPGSKEDVFKSKALSLIDKRRLMRFLMFAAGEFEDKKELEGKEQMPFSQYLREVFSLNGKAVNAIAYAIAFCTTGEEHTLPVLRRIRQYLRSAGRYGASPFLVGHYGGLGETAQGFCRTSAVKGGTYILGRRVLSVKASSLADSLEVEKAASDSAKTAARYEVQLEDIDEQLTSTILLSAPDYVRPSAPITSSSHDVPSVSHAHYPIARCIAILEHPLVFTPVDAPEETPAPEVEESIEGVEDELSDKPAPPNYEVDTALLVFPPGALPDGSTTTAAHALVTGEASMSAPRGKYILNISLPLPTSDPSSPKELLRPYLEAALSLAISPSSPETTPTRPLFTVFYTHNPPSGAAPPSTPSDSGAILTPPPTQLLPAIADVATENAEAMFWKAVEQLKAAGVRRSVVKESYKKSDGEEEKVYDERKPEEIDSFWPPLDATEEDSSTADEW
ncbi:FAD/NAD(P)-binding domain-containing protein [Dichomitus squalens]|uniref:FAD/NAD(P)-binding domain-containing protein n=1 Tax=Dichomitus squalens TaxID=114155 RepID=A0A4Q9Q2H1_9APHY|nr:FAD/NAD(P)-binding domain-containing protein [Dichomitus squalens]TBU61220.1 FAD/NAD(P)-binding domain-containing protein [Dichomitus squalens]